jgi:hypothetical protein
MPSESPNTTVTATALATPAQVLFNATGATVAGVASNDSPCRVYMLHNRDAAIHLRYKYQIIRKDPSASPSGNQNTLVTVVGASGGGVVPPGATIPLSDPRGQIALVQVWGETSGAIVDGFVLQP